MTNFRSLNSSKANMQSVADHNKEAEITMQEQVQEKKQFGFAKFNVDGEKRRGEGEGSH